MALAGCADVEKKDANKRGGEDNAITVSLGDTVNSPPPVPQETVRMRITTGDVHPDTLVAFARTLLGVPYLYASTNPNQGFDCSGFVTYVFNHFNIVVPRSSVDFTDVGKEIDIMESKPGDLVLFTGTDSSIRVVGHMGIVENTSDNKLYFIHSTSGKAKGVVITPFENYYRGRFVKVIRIFPDKFFE